MAVTDYITVEGMILGEVTNGVMRSYGTDALGSVVATYTGGALGNTYRFKPYGSLLAKTGSAIDPFFLWNGASGYRSTGSGPSHYVRSRHYSFNIRQWTTVDSFWPEEHAYVYAWDSPLIRNDPSGRLCIQSIPGSGRVSLTPTFALLDFEPPVVVSPNSHWLVESYIQADFTCTVLRLPCFVCPGYVMGQWPINQWLSQSQMSAAWSPDGPGNVACGIASGNPCAFTQMGKNEPGYSNSKWDPGQESSCDSKTSPVDVYSYQLPLTFTYWFTTCCSLTPINGSQPPTGGAGVSCVVWGYYLGIRAANNATGLDVDLHLL